MGETRDDPSPALPTECAGCHLPQWRDATTPDRKSRGISQDCKTCHDTAGWAPAPGFVHDKLPLTFEDGSRLLVDFAAPLCITESLGALLGCAAGAGPGLRSGVEGRLDAAGEATMWTRMNANRISPRRRVSHGAGQGWHRAALLPLLLWLLALPATASATCMIQCTATLMGPECADTTSVAQGQPIGFWVQCETCCSPPGGPVNCNKTDPYGLQYKLLTASGDPAPGFVSPSAIGCPGKDGVALAFIPQDGKALAHGKYQLVQGGMILVEFEVVASADADAGSADAGANLDAGAAPDVGPGADTAAGADTTADGGAPQDAGAAQDGAAGQDTAAGPDGGAGADTTSDDAMPLDDAALAPDTAPGGEVSAADVQDAGPAPGSGGGSNASGCGAGPSGPAGWPWPVLALLGLVWAARATRRDDRLG